MKAKNGIHFYINIINFNEIILDEESKEKSLKHSLHALDTFFTSIETYGKKQYPKDFIVEKITGSRLHLYFCGDINFAFQATKEISAYAYKLAKYITHDIPKYKSLDDFIINVGADYGKFYEFEFNSKNNFSELTTIGYVANFAAKIQALTEPCKLSISKTIYESLPKNEQEKYNRIENSSIKKYDQDCFYSIDLSSLDSHIYYSYADFDTVKTYSAKVDLSDIEFSGVNKLLNFSDLSKTKCKELEGIPVFSDVRGFTTLFKEDDSNLEEMTQITQNVLEDMYNVSTKNGGVHIQFQGDRELSLYHNIPQMEQCFKKAVLGAMRMIDAVKPYNVHIGVGEDFGRLFATKFGAREEKDNILLGETIIKADRMEDEYANADQIAITDNVYKGLKLQDSKLAEQFKKMGNYYVATIGFEQYSRKVLFEYQEQNTSKNCYNGAWGDL